MSLKLPTASQATKDFEELEQTIGILFPKTRREIYNLTSFERKQFYIINKLEKSEVDQLTRDKYNYHKRVKLSPAKN